MRGMTPDVMLSKAKHLAFSSGYEVEILRLSPQNDIATQSPRGEGIKPAKTVALMITPASKLALLRHFDAFARLPFNRRGKFKIGN